MAKTSTGGRLKAAIFLLVSLFAAALAALVIFTVIRNFQDQLREVSAPPDLERVFVAKRTLWPGETISDEDLEAREFPPELIPFGVLGNRDDAINRVPVERILANEFIRAERLAAPEAGRGLPAIVPKGMRAIQLNLFGGSAVAGFLNPGNFVDVLVTAGEPVKTKTLFQAVTVLAVNDRLGNERKKDEEGKTKGRKRREKPSVTVAVTPDQAEKLTHAHIEGAVTLTLRNDIDVANLDEDELKTVDATNILEANPDEEGEADSTGKPRTTYRRMSIKEYNETKPEDGTLILIKGDDKTEENISSR